MMCVENIKFNDFMFNLFDEMDSNHILYFIASGFDVTSGVDFKANDIDIYLVSRKSIKIIGDLLDLNSAKYGIRVINKQIYKNQSSFLLYSEGQFLYLDFMYGLSCMDVNIVEGSLLDKIQCKHGIVDCLKYFKFLFKNSESNYYYKIKLVKRGLVKRKFAIYLFKLKRIINNIFNGKRGAVIAFLGPDGCGKSTQIDKLSKYFSDRNILKVTNIHFRPKVVGVKNDIPDTAIKAPHSLSQRGEIVSFLKFSYVWLDYILGYIFIVYPQLLLGNLVTFDRYFCDMKYDQRRHRIKISDFNFNLFDYFIPKPDLVVIFDGDPETIRLRKDEIESSEIERIINCYKRHNYKRSKVLVLAIEDSIESNFSKCINALSEVL